VLATLVAPPAPTPGRLLTDWGADAALVGVVALAALYLVGVRRLEGRGRHWPTGRSVSFASGLVVIVVATMSGLAAYDRVLFSMHVVQHVLLGMVAPILLVLGRPVTLALQAGSRPTQERLLAVLHSRPVRAVTNPLVAWALFAGTLVVLYFTGLYELSLRNGWVHAGLHVHFVLAGVLFLAFVVGLDPIPGAMSFGARALFVFVLVPFHAFLGVALLGGDRVIAGDWYRQVERAWGASPLADQRTGAGILWVAGELFGVVALAVVVHQWMRAEERRAVRIDRQLDAERIAGRLPG
jgi:putative copper resistance protein D